MNANQLKFSLVRQISVLFLALASCAAFGYDPSDYSTWMKFAKDNTQGFTTECWADPADLTAPLAKVEEGKCYFVPTDMVMKAPGENATFMGQSLAVAGTVQFGTGNKTYTISDLIVRPGGTVTYGSSITLGGRMTVEGTADDPSMLSTFNFSGRKFYYKSALVGSSDSMLKFGSATSATATRETKQACQHFFTMDMSAFAGEFVLRPDLLLLFDPANSSIPGKITVQDGAILQTQKTSGSYMIGSLAFETGAELNLKTVKSGGEYVSCRFVITNELSFGESFRFGMDYPSTNGFLIAELSGAAAERAPDVSQVDVEVTYKGGELPRNAHLEISEPDANGVKTVRVVWDEMLIMWTTCGGNKVDSFTAGHESDWSSGVIPSADFAGDVLAIENIAFYKYGTLTYNDMVLSIADGARINNQAYTLHLKEVHLAGDSGIYATYGGTDQPHRLYASVFVHGGTVTISGWNNHWNDIHGTISGSGVIAAQHNDVSNYGTRFYGDDSGFTGRYSFTSEDVARNLTRPKHYIQIADGFRFGGDYSGATEDAWKSVYFTNVYVVVSSDVSMTNGTRGVYVNQNNVFEVESGKTMTITEAMTYNGTFMKGGAGALVLGNATTKFIASGAQADTPTDGANVLNVVDGSLEVAAVDAVNGLAVSFGETATLVVNVEATGDLKTYGARNVKWETPFAADAAIPVVFEGEVTDDDLTVAVCTISATAVAPTFDVPVTYAHRKVTAAGWRTNADGTRTYEVTLEKMGVILLVR